MWRQARTGNTIVRSASPGDSWAHVMIRHTCHRVYTGNQYYRYRGRYGVDPEYPLSLDYWKNVRRPVNDVFQHDGVTYFFSGANYQVFDDDRFRVGFAR